jgi:[protein-PII] uridylyltransferase
MSAMTANYPQANPACKRVLLIFDSVGQPERAQALRGEIDRFRGEAAAALAAGVGGRAVSQRLSDALDGMVAGLWEAGVGGVALLATGGWGRRELSPWSDIDLLFATAEPPDDGVRELADRILYPLWDSGLEVGHAVRSVPDSAKLAATDLATATALLDARVVAGDAALGEELASTLARALSKPGDPNAFVKRLLAEKQHRHAKFGDSLFLLEPNLKHGQGGLRDLATGLWAARARFKVRDFADLVPLGQASARQAAALSEAREFLLLVRAAAHLHARRRQDQLSFEIQEAIAPRFHDKPMAQAVEELMRRYYLHARAVVRETDRLLDRATVPPHRPPTIRRLDASFTVFNGHVSATDPGVFQDRPGEIVRTFKVALTEDLPLYGHTKELIAEQVAEGGGRLCGDPDARRHFLDLVVDIRDARQPSVLEEMHELGILAALMPEFAPCTGRVQHDLYHVFTVDQHQLYALALLKRIHRGELLREAPAATDAIRRISRTRALYLAMLLHDVGKPLGKGHSEKGARLAAVIARRLGLSDEEVAQVEFLVLHHLDMMHLSQRRDLDDVEMIGDFAEAIRDEETLRELYLMTYCDTASTAPGNLTDWKDQLLRELYEKTRAYLRRGPELLGADRSALVKRRRRRVAELLEDVGPELEGWLAGLPDRYFAALEPQTIAEQVKLSRDRGARAAAVAVSHSPKKGVSEVLVAAGDEPGLLSKIAGVMLANRIDIMAAQIHTREGLSGAREALDVFHVKYKKDDARFGRLEEDLLRVLGGAQSVEDLIAARRPRSTLRPRVTPEVPTEIAIDNEVSRDFTVIDVFTQDRLGVLYAITRTLSQLGLDIVLSKVATEADRVADIFYVNRVTEPPRLAEIDGRLRAALAEIK